MGEVVASVALFFVQELQQYGSLSEHLEVGLGISSIQVFVLLRICIVAAGLVLAFFFREVGPDSLSLRSAIGWVALGVYAYLGFSITRYLLMRPECVPAVNRDVWDIFDATLVSPLLEELTFRVLLLGGMLKIWGPIPAIVLVSALFAAVHTHYGLFFQLSTLFPAGLIAGAAWWRTRSIGLVYAIHATNNAGFLMFFAARSHIFGQPICGA